MDSSESGLMLLILLLLVVDGCGCIVEEETATPSKVVVGLGVL